VVSPLMDRSDRADNIASSGGFGNFREHQARIRGPDAPAPERLPGLLSIIGAARAAGQFQELPDAQLVGACIGAPWLLMAEHLYEVL